MTSAADPLEIAFVQGAVSALRRAAEKARADGWRDRAVRLDACADELVQMVEPKVAAP